MKVTVYFNSSYPNGMAATNRLHQICKGLVSNDVNVDLIITNPTENKSHTINSTIKGFYEGVKFKYLSLTTVRKKNIFPRKLIDCICHLKAYIHILFKSKNTDAIIIIGGATTDFRILIPFIAKLSRKRVFLEINEYPFVSQRDTLFKSLKLFLFFKIILPAYDGFIVISDNLRIEIMRFKRKSARIIKIPILSEKPKIDEHITKPPFIHPYIIHAGSLIETKDGILSSLEAFKVAREKLNYGILYIIAGDHESSPIKTKIEKFIQDNNLQNAVYFIGYKVKSELSQYYKHAHLAIVNKCRSKQNKYGFATKISEYVAFRVPLILTSVGEIKNYFKDGFNATLVEPGNIEQLSEAIIYHFRNRDKVLQMANNAFKLLDQEFNPSYHGAFLKDFLRLKNTLR